MKRIVLVVAVLLIAAGIGFSQNLTVLEDDFNAFFESIGREVLPHAQQAAINGISTGDASIPAYRSFTIGTSAGAVFSDGWADAIDPDDYETLPINDFIQEALALVSAGSVDVANIYNNFIPYPLSRLTMGGTIAGWQILATGAWFPNALTETVVGFIPSGDGGLDLSQTELSVLNIGGQVRKTLIEDAPGFPAITAGLGYTYEGFKLSVPFPSFDDLIEGATIGADSLTTATSIHTAGLELSISKKLAFFVPFVSVTPYYQRSSFSGAINGFTAEIGEPGDAGYISYTEQGGDDPGAVVNVYDFALATRAGFDLVFGGFGFFVHGQYSLATNAFGATTGLRFSF